MPSATSVARGFARRLWHQEGLRGRPKLDAMTIVSSPSARSSTGSVRGFPVRAPVVVSIAISTPASHDDAVAAPPVSRETSRSSGCWITP